jgi:hypothetical protein
VNFFSIFKRNFIFLFKKKIDIDKIKIDNNSLDKLFLYFGSDKANKISKKHQSTHRNHKLGHGFTKFYEKHLNKFKKQKIRILEIGSLQGASAAAFAKYFPKAEIYCIDINLRNFEYSSNRISVFGMDSSNPKMIKNFLVKIKFDQFKKGFDVIIDDGSHILSDQLKALNFFYKHVSNKGFYIIEDYKFSNYFKHLKDVNDLTINEVIHKINKKNFFHSPLIDKEVLKDLFRSVKNIYKHKGNSAKSDIVFFEKKPCLRKIN